MLPGLKEKLVAFAVLFVVFMVIEMVFLWDTKHWNGIDPKEDMTLLDKAFNRMYFIISTHSSVGYGDISPKTKLARCIIMVQMVMVIVQVLEMVV
jgi:hypothetical protein